MTLTIQIIGKELFDDVEAAENAIKNIFRSTGELSADNILVNSSVDDGAVSICMYPDDFWYFARVRSSYRELTDYIIKNII